MSEQPSTLAVKPIIHYPESMETGKTYVMTVDLEIVEGSQWRYDREEYPVYCYMECSRSIQNYCIGEPVVVMHTNGGSYGAIQFLLETSQVQKVSEGSINITLVNQVGFPIENIELDIKILDIQKSPSRQGQERLLEIASLDNLSTTSAKSFAQALTTEQSSQRRPSLPSGTLTLKPEYCEEFKKKAKKKFGRAYVKKLEDTINQKLAPQQQISYYTFARILRGQSVRPYNLLLMCQYFDVDWQDVCVEGELKNAKSLEKKYNPQKTDAPLSSGSLTLKPEYCKRFKEEARGNSGSGRYLKRLEEAVNQTLESKDHISRDTITRALNGTSVRAYNMLPICQYFGVSWQEACVEGNATSNGQVGSTTPDEELESLVEQVLGKVQFDFSSRTLAGGAHTSSSWVQDNFVELDFYEVDHQPADYPVLDPTVLKYQENSDDNGFVRQRLRFPRSKKITLRHLLEKYRSIFIYGDPGSGKTSCLEWIALKCRAGELFEGCVPIFLGSRRFATANKSETLLSLFEKMFIQWGFLPTDLNKLLESGRVVFILDGLDETPVAERERMEIMISELIRDYPRCHFFCSSRLGLVYSFSNNFPKVFVASFKRNQIEDFITYWFSQPGKDPGLGALMIQKLKSTTYSGIKELSTRPVLLELLCFVFEGIQDFPPRRFEIFRNGIQRMTRKNIQIATDIPELSVLREQHIYTILCLVASYFFINQKGQIIFPTLAVEGIIRQYFQETLNIDGISVPDRKILQAIEQSNGLLTRWADDFCSFSHLTYQEFFTAEYLVKTGRYREVYNYIDDPRWHYVIGLVAECIPHEKTLSFFTDFKERIDQQISEDGDVEPFLSLLDRVTKTTAATVQGNRPNMATYVRAWYFVYALQDAGQVTNIGPIKRYFELPDFDFATSTVSNKQLECHGLVYKVYHRMHQKTMGPDSFIKSLEQLVRLLAGDIKNTEVVKGWLKRIGREQLKYESADAWWTDHYDNWNTRIMTFVGTLNIPCTIGLTESHCKKLRDYYEATKLLSICMNRSQLNDLQRQVLADSMLLPQTPSFPN